VQLKGFAENQIAMSIFLKLSLRAWKIVFEVTLNTAMQVFSVHLKDCGSSCGTAAFRTWGNTARPPSRASAGA